MLPRQGSKHNWFVSSSGQKSETTACFLRGLERLVLSVSGERLLLQTPTLLSCGCLRTGYVFRGTETWLILLGVGNFAQAKLSGGLQETWINNTAVLYYQVERYPLPRPNTKHQELSISWYCIKIIYLMIKKAFNIWMIINAKAEVPFEWEKKTSFATAKISNRSLGLVNFSYALFRFKVLFEDHFIQSIFQLSIFLKLGPNFLILGPNFLKLGPKNHISVLILSSTGISSYCDHETSLT